MRVSKTDIVDGPLLIEPVVHGDARGFFVETYRRDTLAAAGADYEFVQDNHSRSRAGVIRGLHFQAGQAKLVRCVRGAIFDVAVDVRVGSPSFGEWVGFKLDDERHHQLLVPDGFAHGFCVLSELADVVYKVSSYYDPATEGGFRFDDPAVGVQWPQDVELLISDRDRSAPTLAELSPSLPFRYGA
jgi:dTDP-4-dehydrorhamnose 3,5-epimerase